MLNSELLTGIAEKTDIRNERPEYKIILDVLQEIQPWKVIEDPAPLTVEINRLQKYGELQ